MRPIILSRGKVSETTDSAGVSIRKTTLAKPGPPGPYEFTQHAPTSTEVPSLAFFCINALVPYPEQVSMDFQLPYDASNPEKRDLLTELNADEPSQVDPRLWAILVQLYSGLPHQWYTYHIPLGDRHLPLLQCIPSTEYFALITVLELSGSREVNDDTIFELKQLRTLVALDLSATELSTLGVLHLANTVAWASTEASQPEMRGPWALRILDLRGCKKINQDALPYLDSFKLLSVVGQHTSLNLGNECLSDCHQIFDGPHANYLYQNRVLSGLHRLKRWYAIILRLWYLPSTLLAPAFPRSLIRTHIPFSSRRPSTQRLR